MQKIGIVADEAIDLPEEIIKENNISTVKFKLDLQELEKFPGNIYQKMREAEKQGLKSFVKTSQPSINDFLVKFKEKLQEFEEIICIVISSKISGTYNSAFQAKKFLDKDQQEKVVVFDTLNATGSEGLLTLRAISLIKQGVNKEEIVQKLTNLLDKVKLLGMYQRAQWLNASGRLPKMVTGGLLQAEKINIRPIFELRNGALKLATVKRSVDGPSRALFNEFEKRTKKIREQGVKITTAITHADNMEQARELEKLLLNTKNTENSFINPVCLPLGGHLGPGCLILSWITE